MKNSNDTIWNRTRDIQVSSAMFQSNAPQRVPVLSCTELYSVTIFPLKMLWLFTRSYYNRKLTEIYIFDEWLAWVCGVFWVGNGWNESKGYKCVWDPTQYGRSQVPWNVTRITIPNFYFYAGGNTALSWHEKCLQYFVSVWTKCLSFNTSKL